jgi:hypothetical protein
MGTEVDRLWRLVYKLASRIQETAWRRGQLWVGDEPWNTYDVTYTYAEEPSQSAFYMIDPSDTSSWSVDPSDLLWVTPPDKEE